MPAARLSNLKVRVLVDTEDESMLRVDVPW